jgi:type VI secretion system secreted protein VgrG
MAASYLKLTIDGQDIKDVILQHVSITQALNDHYRCHAEFRHTEDQRGSQTSAITVETWLGKNFQVLEAGGNSPDHVLFDGLLLEVELVYEHSGGYTAFLQGITRSFKMDLTPRHAYYQEMSLADIAARLAGHADLQANVTCQNRRPLNYVQWGESDFEFLHRLADDHGCWMRPTAQGIEIFDSFQKSDDAPKVFWRKESGENALRGLSVKGVLAPATYNGAHYDFHQMRSKVYQSISDETQFYDSVTHFVNAVKQGSAKLPPAYLQQRSRMVTLEEYEDLLKKESVRSVGGSITASGESINTKLLPGNEVTIDGTDAHGTYGITHVSHNWDVSGYTNQFTCTPWKNYTDSNPPPMKPWFGVVPARVVEHNDPKKMGRIKVQYFWQEEGPAYWARMMTPHAGSDRGFMFMPEVGDEVVVAFEDGDPERPVILGCVWNGVDQAPRQEFWGGELESNDVKRIVTKSGHRIQMVDKEGKESISIATPKFLKLSMIEKTDETGRSMITLHTDNGDIFLSAPNGRIHFISKYVSREVGAPT